MQAAEQLVHQLYALVKQRQYTIGHMKFLVDQSIKISCTWADGPDTRLPQRAAATVNLLVNLRVQAGPQAVQDLLNAAIDSTAAATGCTITVHSNTAFQPGYPRPTYRM